MFVFHTLYSSFTSLHHGNQSNSSCFAPTASAAVQGGGSAEHGRGSPGVSTPLQRSQLTTADTFMGL